MAKLNVGRFQEQANAARELYQRTGDINALYQMIVALAEMSNVAMEQFKQDGLNNPQLQSRIQTATQAYRGWLSCLKSCADSKGQVQKDLSRFR